MNALSEGIKFVLKGSCAIQPVPLIPASRYAKHENHSFTYRLYLTLAVSYTGHFGWFERQITYLSLTLAEMAGMRVIHMSLIPAKMDGRNASCPTYMRPV